MNAITLLTRQHREVEALFSRLASATEDDKDELFEELADTLSAHTTIEEQIFYPAVYSEKLSSELREAVEEHLASKRIIADLLTMSAADAQFEAKVKVLKEQIEHHVKEEERDLFPLARRERQASMDELGDQMERLYDTLLQQQPSTSVFSETAQAAPLPGDEAGAKQ